MSDIEEYKSGYGRPPKKSRFQKGQSGNPKGRPKGAKNFATVIDEELNSRIPVTENGKRRKITKLQAIGKQFVNKAVGGCSKSAALVMNETRAIEVGEGRNLPVLLTPEDDAVTESILRRLRLIAEANNESDPAENPSEAIQKNEAEADWGDDDSST